TMVIAAVNVVLPWSTWPIVPILQCGLLRSNFALAICGPRSLRSRISHEVVRAAADAGAIRLRSLAPPARAASPEKRWDCPRLAGAGGRALNPTSRRPSREGR